MRVTFKSEEGEYCQAMPCLPAVGDLVTLRNNWPTGRVVRRHFREYVREKRWLREDGAHERVMECEVSLEFEPRP